MRRPDRARFGHAAPLALVAAAALVALAPRPAGVVERLYAGGVYPVLQAALTTLSNAVPFALFDGVIVVTLSYGLWLWGRAASRARHRRSVHPILAAGRVTVAMLAAGYLWFVIVWGLNYARPPIDARLKLPSEAATASEVASLLTRAVDEVNALWGPAQADGLSSYNAERDIARALHAVEARHGRPRPTVPGRPKPTLLAVYFRMAGVDGLTAPAALETLLNPDLTSAESPFVLAHEWAHLSGYADEADANFVAWLTTTEDLAGPHSRYSGWLFLVMETAAQLPRETRLASLATLRPGVRRDLDAIAARARTHVDIVQRVGWRVYDGYLKSQGVREGIVSYSRVVDLVARSVRGSTPPAGGRPPVPQ